MHGTALLFWDTYVPYVHLRHFRYIYNYIFKISMSHDLRVSSLTAIIIQPSRGSALVVAEINFICHPQFIRPCSFRVG